MMMTETLDPSTTELPPPTPTSKPSQLVGK